MSNLWAERSSSLWRQICASRERKPAALDWSLLSLHSDEGTAKGPSRSLLARLQHAVTSSTEHSGALQFAFGVIVLLGKDVLLVLDFNTPATSSPSWSRFGSSASAFRYSGKPKSAASAPSISSKAQPRQSASSRACVPRGWLRSLGSG